MAATVKVQSLRAHTYNNVARPEGTIYEIDPEHPETLETIEALGMARRVPDAPAAPPPPPSKKK
jgi:hypothetical protein